MRLVTVPNQNSLQPTFFILGPNSFYVKKLLSASLMASQKVRKAVAPGKAGAQNRLIEMDSRLRGNEENGIKKAL
jgi:hypothetical protein